MYLEFMSDLPCVKINFVLTNIYLSKDVLVFSDDTIITKKKISDTKSISECMAKL